MVERQSPLFADPRHVLIRPWLEDARLELYEAEHLRTSERRLVLLASHDALRHGKGLDAWIEGARVAAKLKHQALPPPLDAGPTEDRGAFASYPLGTTRTSSQVLEKSGALSIEQACGVAISVLSALHVAHGANLPHAAICPDTVLLDLEALGGPQVLLLGLGPCLAIRRQPNMHDAPERLVGAPPSERCDFYSVAALVVSLLSPATKDRPRDWVVESDLPETLRDTLVSALAIDPQQRPASARSFAFELAGFATPHDSIRSVALSLPSETRPRQAIHPDSVVRSMRSDTRPSEEPARERLRRASVPQAPTVPRLRIPRGQSPRPRSNRTARLPAAFHEPKIRVRDVQPSEQHLASPTNGSAAHLPRQAYHAAKAVMLAATGVGLGLWLAWLTGLI